MILISKTGRNDPCPCGSGKKYKKCCLHQDEQKRFTSKRLEELKQFKNFIIEEAPFQELFVSHYYNFVEFPHLREHSEAFKTYSEWLLLNDNPFAYFRGYFRQSLFDSDSLSKIPDELDDAEKVRLDFLVHMYQEQQEQSEIMSSSVEEIIQNWKFKVPSLYRVEKAFEGEQGDNGWVREPHVDAVDIFSGESYRILLGDEFLTLELTEDLLESSLLLATLVDTPIDEEFLPLMTIAPLPMDLEDNIKAYIFEEIDSVDELADDPSPLIVECFNYFEAIQYNAMEVYIEQIEWPKEIHKQVAEEFLENIKNEGLYSSPAVWTTIELWNFYVLNNRPAIRKAPGGAAALEYFTASQESAFGNMITTQQELAEEYGTSAATIAKYYNILAEYLPVFKKSHPYYSNDIDPIESDDNDFSHDDELEPESDKEKAQELLYDAFETEDSQKRVKLAKKALEIYPDSPDGYVILAEEAKYIEDALDYYFEGLKAGEKDLGEDFFNENKGYFWGLHETRPYMRAKEGFAYISWQLGDNQTAIEEFQHMLELNPNDNQGVRYLLIQVLLEQDLVDEAKSLIEEYGSEPTAFMTYSKVLVHYMEKGFASKEQLDKLIKEAINANPHVANLLSKDLGLVLYEPVMQYVPGEESEAIAYLIDANPVWADYPELIEYLSEFKVNTYKK